MPVPRRAGDPAGPGWIGKRKPARRGGDHWRASIDHIVPLAAGGRDDATNKRAAHALRYDAGQEHWGRGRRPLSYAIRDVINLAGLLGDEQDNG